MKILVLTAFIAALALGDPKADDQTQSQWPWQVGKQYRYDVVSHNLARLEEGQSSGSVFRAKFVIRAVAPGQLQAKLENPQHALLHQEIQDIRELPQDLKYEPVPKLDQPFEISVEGGRIKSLNLPSTFSLSQENLLKGLIGSLQVDLSTHRVMHNSHDQYDKEAQQGLFSKMETDVTGDCKTLYAISPVSDEWRRELTSVQPIEEPIEITKSKNYGHCHHRVAYHFGVPKGSEWTGTAHKTHEEQLVRRSTVSRILAGKKGPLYKIETTSTVQVNPLMFGKQKGEVLSYIQMNLVQLEQDNEAAWPKLEGGRAVPNLLYSMTNKPVAIEDRSSSSSSSESNEHQYASENMANPRSRRSIKKIVSINKVVVKRNDKDSSSSSSESTQHYVNDDMPTNNEPAYAALYMSPQPRADKKQNPMNVQKLVQDTAQQLQNPNNMPRADFLSKFNILVRTLASMSYDQLSRTSSSIEIAKSSNNMVKVDMWMVFRDAMAQTGTLPAFQQIKNWVQTKKIEGEEAAQVIASLAGSLRYPTKEIMTQFFDLALSPEVRQQEYLNSTALLTATRLINQAQVNNESAHSFYPTHMYGRLAHKHDPFVYQKILPRLSQELSQAVEEGDSVKAQVYIRAIGNLGHRQILKEFAPYLEGQKPVSTYLRREMINSLDVLAHQQDKLVRTVLYKILRNTAEPYEVRVAAIHNLLMARPTPAMMMAMAQMTYSDPAIHVRAALKSSIESASQLQSPRYQDLARTANAAKWMLTKEDLGVQYSGKNLKDSYKNKYDMDIMSALSYTGSRDSLFPNFLKYSMRDKLSNQANSISASFSSVRQFSDYVQEQMRKMYYPKVDSQPDQRFSPEKIAEQLNIKRNDEQPLEASFYVDIMNQQRFFAFSDYDLQQLPKTITQYFANLNAGVDKHYTKVLNQAQVSIMFPVATGMPFIYKYKEPTVVHMQGKVKGQIPKEKTQEPSASISKDIYFTYARNLDGSLGYMDTLVNQYVSAGVINKLQVNIPIKFEMEMKSGELKINLEPLRPDQDQTILHYSVWPYTASQKKDSMVAVSLDLNTKVITRPYKVSDIDTKFGQAVGTAFQFQGYSYSSDYKNIANLWNSGDWLANIAFASKQKDIALTHYNFKYLAKQSQNKRITLTAVYDAYYNLKENSQEGSAPSKIQDATPNSEARRLQLVKRVSSGINTAKAQVLDLSASFEGPQQSTYVFTYALASGLTDPKIQHAFYAAKNSPQQPAANNQINGFGKVVKPEESKINFMDALKKEMKTLYEANIIYGQSGNIKVQGYAERTKEYSEQLKNHPSGKACQEETARNNLYQDACQKAIIMAHAPNYIKSSVTYKDVNPAVKNMIYQAYKICEHAGFWYTEVNPTKVTPDGKLDVEAKISYFEKTLNLVLNTRLGEVRAKNVPIPKASSQALAVYTPFKAYERVNNYYTKQQYQPFCTIDHNTVKTFSNRTYQYALSPAWHVAMHYDGNQVDDKLAVLTRRPSEKQQELYIAYRSKNGMHLELEVKSAPEDNKQKYNVKVNTNAKKVSEGENTMYYDEKEEIPMVQYYTDADGVLMVNIKEERLRVMFDGQRLVLLSREERNKNRGICGYMSGSSRYDYMTPSGDMVDEPQYYAASYALKEESDPKTQQLQVEAEKAAYKPKNKYTAILRQDDEFSKIMRSSSSSSSSSSEEETGSQNVYRTRNYRKERGECKTQEQVQYYENYGEICISNRRVPACQSHCRGSNYELQPVMVICRPKIDQQFVSYRDMIRQGENPKVDGAPHIKQFRVPTSCVV